MSYYILKYYNDSTYIKVCPQLGAPQLINNYTASPVKQFKKNTRECPIWILCSREGVLKEVVRVEFFDIQLVRLVNNLKVWLLKK